MPPPDLDAVQALDHAYQCPDLFGTGCEGFHARSVEQMCLACLSTLADGIEDLYPGEANFSVRQNLMVGRILPRLAALVKDQPITTKQALAAAGLAAPPDPIRHR